ALRTIFRSKGNVSSTTSISSSTRTTRTSMPSCSGVKGGGVISSAVAVVMPASSSSSRTLPAVVVRLCVSPSTCSVTCIGARSAASGGGDAQAAPRSRRMGNKKTGRRAAQGACRPRISSVRFRLPAISSRLLPELAHFRRQRLGDLTLQILVYHLPDAAQNGLDGERRKLVVGVASTPGYSLDEPV